MGEIDRRTGEIASLDRAVLLRSGSGSVRSTAEASWTVQRQPVIVG
jgi:hypothetical protein